MKFENVNVDQMQVFVIINKDNKIIIGFRSVFIYFHWYLYEDNTIITNINSNTETVIYGTYK